MYGQLLPKNWNTLGAIATMVGAFSSTSWGAFVCLEGEWRNIVYARSSYDSVSIDDAVDTLSAVRAAIALRFGENVRVDVDASKLANAHPSMIFAPALTSKTQLPSPRRVHGQLLDILRQFKAERKLFAAASHRDALIELLSATLGCLVPYHSASRRNQQQYSKRHVRSHR